jgi:hypothetical protein
MNRQVSFTELTLAGIRTNGADTRAELESHLLELAEDVDSDDQPGRVWVRIEIIRGQARKSSASPGQESPWLR